MATEHPLDIFIEGDGVLGNDEGEIVFAEVTCGFRLMLVNGEGRQLRRKGGARLTIN